MSAMVCAVSPRGSEPAARVEVEGSFPRLGARAEVDSGLVPAFTSEAELLGALAAATGVDVAASLGAFDGVPRSRREPSAICGGSNALSGGATARAEGLGSPGAAGLEADGGETWASMVDALREAKKIPSVP